MEKEGLYESVEERVNIAISTINRTEVYTNLATKLAMVIIYILVGLIVIGIINKAIEEAFKFQNKSNRGNKNALKRSCPLSKML